MGLIDRMVNSSRPVDGYRFIETDLEIPLEFPFVGGSVAVFTKRAPGKESPSEDTAALIPYGDNSGVLLVADGLGGAPAGRDAARIAVEKVTAAVRRAVDQQQMLRDGILDGIEKANRAIMDLGVGAATTLVVVEIQDNAVRTYHIGDSMILVTGQRGKIKFRTIPHSPVGYAVEAGMLNETEAAHHADRHIVSNVLGSGEMRIDIGPTIMLAARDTLILASDGVSDNLFEAEIVESIRCGPLRRCATQLALECGRFMEIPVADRHGKPDDMTFILFRMKD